MPVTDFALFLDFDGTLVEIAPRPDQVVVPPELAPALLRLRDRLGGALAIVTGRPIAVIDDFLSPARFDVAGLHGVERRVDGVVSGGRAEDHPALRARITGLKDAVRDLESVLIEDKGASVAVHWRLATPTDAAQAEEAVKAAAADLGDAYRLQLGKAVGEIVPASATKGHAIRALSEAPPYAGRRAMFLGDDLTDEKAFAVVNEEGGVSVRIGGSDTIATRRLTDPDAVRALALAAALEEAERLEGPSLARCLAGVSAPAELRAFVLGPGAVADGLGIRALPSGAAQHGGDLGGGDAGASEGPGEPKGLAGVPSCGTPARGGVGDAGLLDGGSLGGGIDGLGSGAAGALAR